MKILLLTKYTRKGASSRLRSFQYIPALERAGYTITIAPLFNDKYLQDLYSGRLNLVPIPLLYIKRLFQLLTIRDYDVIFIEYEIFPFLPAWAEKMIAAVGVKYVVDYDDAIFHNYDQNKNLFIRKFLSKKIDTVMKYSTCVIAGNDYIASRAKKAGASCTEILPTVIDLDRYNVKRERKAGPVIIGWIGSPSTFKYLKKIKKILQYIVGAYNVKIHIIGAKGDLGFSKNVHFIEWSESTEVENILRFDIGIMPLEDSLWEKGKCGYKLIQYMACRLPVVASPIGVNKKLIREGLNGFLAGTDEEWLNAFKNYIQDPALFEKHGNAGFEMVRKKYSLQVTGNKFVQILKT